jgi:hypothetical protein
VNKLRKTILILALIATAQVTRAMNYEATNSDMLLLIRGTINSTCVEVDLGSVSNLLALAPNTITNIAPPNFTYLTNQEKTNYTSFANAVYTISAVSGVKKTAGAWITYSSGPIQTFGPSGLEDIQSAMGSAGSGIGGEASSLTGNVQGSNFVSNTSDAAQSYVGLFNTAGGVPSDFGGNYSFVVEAQPTNAMAFYQFNQTNGLSSQFVPTLVGSFSMNATNGTITFTRAAAVVAPVLVPSRIVGVVRSGDVTQVSFTTTNGDNYQLLYMTNQDQAGWITNSSAGVVAGNNATNTLDDTTTDELRFYRIQSF